MAGPKKDNLRIDVVSDTICPWCFVGKRRLERAMAERPELDFTIDWRPFQLNPDMPGDGMARDQYVTTKFGGAVQAERFYAVIGEAGRGEGIEFDFGACRRVPNTVDSHRLIRWAGSTGLQDAVVEALFRQYFEAGADIGDAGVLLAIAESAGLDGALVKDLLADHADRQMVSDEDATARRMGITGVPCFIIERKFAVMGAHEPAAFHSVFDKALAETRTG